jgi:O-antigen ligase
MCGVAVATAFFFGSLKRYELALALLIVSPWFHWAFASNEESSLLEAVEETGPATYIRLGLVMLVGAVGYMRYANDCLDRTEPLPKRFVFLALFFTGALFSTAYSIAKDFTFIRATESLVFLGFLLGLNGWLTNRAALDRALNTVVLLVSGAVALNLASITLFPGRAWWWEAPNRFQGLMNQPNELGMFCMIAYPLLMWRFRRGGVVAKAATAAVFCAALGMHVLSGSRSSFLCAAVGFALWHLVLGQRMKLALLCTLLGVGITLVSTSLIPSLERNESEKLTDLTGRDEFWRNGAALVAQRPLQGYGYQVSGMVWNDPRFATESLENSWSSARASLHNGYLDTLIGLGFIGLLAWVAILVMPIPSVLRLPSSDYKALALVMLLQVMQLNFAETVITSSRSYGSIVFWCFWVIGGRLPALMAAPEADAQPQVPTIEPVAVSIP